MKKILLYLFVCFILNSCKKDKDVVPPAKVNLVDDSNYTFTAEVKDGKLLLSAVSKTGTHFSPAIYIDVNRNDKLDATTDRGYGETSTGAFCPFYLITSTSTSFCGAIPSDGSLSKNGSSFVFNIPLSEILPADKDTVSLIVTIYNPATRVTQYYPLFSATDFFAKTFLVKVR